MTPRGVREHSSRGRQVNLEQLYVLRRVFHDASLHIIATKCTGTIEQRFNYNARLVRLIELITYKYTIGAPTRRTRAFHITIIAESRMQ